MNVEILNHCDYWSEVKNAAMNTIGKGTGKYPSSDWKMKILKSEHSPIRMMKFKIRFTDIPYYVVMHLVRHHVGCDHFVESQREDRTKTHTKRSDLPQDNPVSYTMVANAQALINISRKRLCNCASKETREAWQEVKDKVAKVEPELASCMVRECVYRGFCPEMVSCGYHKTEAYKKELEEYRKGINE